MIRSITEIDQPETDIKAPVDIAVARQRFLQCRETIARNTVELFEIAAAIHDESAKACEIFLLDCRVPAEDVETFLKSNDFLKKHAAALEKSHVSFEVLMAVLNADEPTQAAVMKLIEIKAALGVETVEKIAGDLRGGHYYTKKEFLRGGAVAMREATSRTEESLKAKARSLHAMLMDDSPEATKEAAALAGEILPEFEKMFGTEHANIENWLHLAIDDPNASYIAQAHMALQLAVRETDAYFSVDGLRWDGRDAIAFLAGVSWGTSNRDIKREPRHISKLSAVEICAGSGGMTLGLESASFSILALNEINSEYASVLRRNRPDWRTKLMVADIRDSRSRLQIEDEVKETPVDLIAGALPTEPFAASGKGGKDKRQLLTSALRLVRRIKPKAFAFEVHPEFDTKGHLVFRQKFFRVLNKLGYGFGFFTLSAEDHGLPQKRQQTFLIGLQEPYWKRFKPPGVSVGERAGLYRAIQRVAFPKRSSYSVNLEWNWGPDAKPVPAPDDPSQRRFDEWPISWNDEYGMELAPDIRGLRSQALKVDDWSKVGLSTLLAKSPATAETVTGRLMPVPLTIPILKRLQGLPDEWDLSGSTLVEQEKQLINMTPPPLALAIGRAIHAAITEEEVDPRHKHTRIIDSGKELPLPLHYFRRGGKSVSDRARADAWRDGVKAFLSE